VCAAKQRPLIARFDCVHCTGAYGVCAQLFWDRALGLPLERPKSVTSEWLENFIKNNPEGLQ
jgi:hypothetical protein